MLKSLPVAMALIVGLSTYCRAQDTKEARKAFIGKAATGSNYRCRFTFASTWNVYPQRLGDAGEGALDVNYFVPIPNGPIDTSAATRPGIDLMSRDFKHKGMPPYRMKAGYPDPDLLVGITVVSRRHVQIDGCPATILVLDSKSNEKSHRGTWLHVYVPKGQIGYDLGGWGDETASDVINQEMQAMIASFHIEKAVSTGRKR